MNGTPTWVNWFGDLVTNIYEAGETGLTERVEDIGEVRPSILKYIDEKEKADPFSVILYFAQTFNRYEEEHKEQVRRIFGIGNHSDVSIPAPPGPPDFREDKCPYNTKLLWKLFRQARQGIEEIDAEVFANSIENINGVGPGNLTLGLFFINPEVFMPIIGATMPVIQETLDEYKETPLDELKKQIEDSTQGWKDYKCLLNKLQSASCPKRPFYKIYAECINGKERSWLSRLGGICCKVSGLLKYRGD